MATYQVMFTVVIDADDESEAIDEALHFLESGEADCVVTLIDEVKEG